MPDHTLVRMLCAAALLAGAAVAHGQPAKTPPASGHDDHGHSHAEVARPPNFAAGLAQIQRLTAEIRSRLDAGDLAGVDSAAHSLSQYAAFVGRLALAEDSGVPRDKVRQANLDGRDLAKAADAVHDAAADANPDASRKAFADVARLVDRIAAVAPQQWICDMHCEGAKVYPGPGVCPVCKMPFKKLSEVPYSAKVKVDGEVKPGSPAALSITLLDPAGNPVRNLDTVHEHKVHMIIVSNDLSWYTHEHPVSGPEGTFSLSTLAFPHPGKYTMFFDFVPTGAGQQVASFPFRIAGDTPAAKILTEDYDSVNTVDGYEFRIRCNGRKFFAGEDSFLRFGIDKDGKPVTDIQPHMGALGHLVIISADLKHYVHSHPFSAAESDGHDHAAGDGHDHGHDHGGLAEKAAAVNFLNGKPSDVTFHARFPVPGLYRAFAQFKLNGKIVTVPFTIDAQPSETAPSGDAGTPAHDHSTHGAGDKSK